MNGSREAAAQQRWPTSGTPQAGHLVLARRGDRELPRWIQPAGGGCSHRGFYLHAERVLTWGWDDITTATMAKPGAVQIRGNSVHGPVAWALCSDWAELLFITWALTRHPRHPQLLNGQWLPPGRVDHAHTHHQPVLLTSLGLPPAAETRGPPRMTTSAFLS